jgi:hypothetical protein
MHPIFTLRHLIAAAVAVAAMTASRLPRLLRLGAAGVLALAVLWAPAAVSAKCAAPPAGGDRWASADAVFVGTVMSVASGDRWATVRVEEVWQGPDQPAEVVVRGGPEGDAFTSVDRTYEAGVRYIFAVTVEDGALLDNSCSGTTEVGATDLEAVRPAEIRQPGSSATVSSHGGPDLDGLMGPLAVVAVVGGLLLVTVLLARRREA